MSKILDTAVGRKPVRQMSTIMIRIEMQIACGTSASGLGSPLYLETQVVTIGFSTFVPRTGDYGSWMRTIHRKHGLQTWGHFVSMYRGMKHLNRPKAYLGLE